MNVHKDLSPYQAALLDIADAMQRTLREIRALPETVECPERELEAWPA